MIGYDVLVVEDDPGTRKMILALLELEGYRALAARNGAEGIELVVREHPQVVLLDMHMPALDGWGVVARLREQGLVCQIVIMTASSEAQIWADHLGAIGYLVKPFQLSELLGIVDQLCHPQAQAA